MRVVIAGAGSVGRSIARELLAHSHEVTLIDHQSKQIQVASVADADWVLADACSPEALADAGVRQCDVLVAATGDDKANLVVSLLAKTEFAVPRVVARVNNPKNEWMFDAGWGVDVAVSTPRIMTAVVEEAVSVGTLVPLFTFHDARTTLCALTLADDSPLVGTPVEDFDPPGGAILTAILRDAAALVPSGGGVLRGGDELVLLVPDDEHLREAIIDLAAP